MSPGARDKLDSAVNDLLGFAAILDAVQEQMERNAASSKPLVPPCWRNYRVHLLTDMQARAFDFALSQMIDAADDLRRVYDAID